jgi:hypothetical protein
MAAPTLGSEAKRIAGDVADAAAGFVASGTFVNIVTPPAPDIKKLRLSSQIIAFVALLVRR